MADYVRKRLGDVFIDTFQQYGVAVGGAAFVTGLETLPATIPIQSDANFLCVHTLYDPGIVDADTDPRFTLLQGGVLVTITDGATQRALSNIPIPVNCLFGQATMPYMWPLTHLFRANTPIGIQVTGTAAAMINITVRLIFGGFKVPVGSVPGTNL